MGRLGTLLLKGFGVLLLAILALSVVATVVTIVFSVVATVVSVVVTAVVLGVLLLALVGLGSVLRRGTDADDASEARIPSSETDRRDPESRLRDRYVAGEIDDDEFERQLDLLLETDDFETGLEADRSSGRESDRSRLRDR